jgi:thioester reductase-like protein
MQPAQHEPVAIVGYGFRLPGGVITEEDLWKLLVERQSVRVDATERFSHGRLPSRILVGSGADQAAGHPFQFPSGNLGLLGEESVCQFDPQFFSISPTEAATMVPQFKMLLMCAWEAVEHAGQDVHKLRGARVGVFVGTAESEAEVLTAGNGPTTHEGAKTATMTGKSVNMAANRISYHMSLTGPSITYLTACSSSATALHGAISSLAMGECDSAIVGGAQLLAEAASVAGFGRLGILSRSGVCRPFDAEADGYTRSEGCVVFFLKPLAAAEANNDQIYGIIRGAYVNSAGPGAGSSFFLPGRAITAPTIAGQLECMEGAYRRSAISPDRVSYIEAHGTGTKVGDESELSSLSAFFANTRDHPIRVSSVKGNVGHLESTSFVVSLLKVCLMMKRRQYLPISSNFRSISPGENFPGTTIQTAVEPFPEGGPEVIIGINSFGFGGSNAHVIVEEYRQPARSYGQMAVDTHGRAYLLPLSAPSEAALKRVASTLADFLSAPTLPQECTLHTLCGNLSLRRTMHRVRRGISCTSLAAAQKELVALLEEPSQPPPLSSEPRELRHARLLFIFPGQGSQWSGMGLRLYETEPAFRKSVDKIDGVWCNISGGTSLRTLAFRGSQEELDQCQSAQPAIFMLQAALVDTLREWCISPSAVLGHSAGEVAAAYACGVLNLSTAIEVVYWRAKVQQTLQGTGRMLSVSLAVDKVKGLIEMSQLELEVACMNSPGSCVVSGPEAAVLTFVKRLEMGGTQHRLLRGGIAFHSHFMDPIEEELKSSLSFLAEATAPAALPSCTWFSSVTGGPSSASSAAYWWDNVRKPVNFAKALSFALRSDRFDAVIELSPHITLRASSLECMEGMSLEPAPPYLTTSVRGLHCGEMLMKMLVALYEAGFDLNAHARSVFVSGVDPITHMLPPYPFHLEVDELARTAFRANCNLGPLSAGPYLGERALSPMHDGASEYTNMVSSDHYPILSQHVVQGVALWPAAAHVELCLEAMAVLPCAILDAHIESALEIHGTRVLSTKVEPDVSYSKELCYERITVASCERDSLFSRDASGERVHFRAKLQSAGSPRSDSCLSSKPETLASQQISFSSDGTLELNPAEYSELYFKDGLTYEYIQEALNGMYEYGPAFQCLRRIWMSRSLASCWANVEMDRELFESGNEQGMVIHPTLLDAATHPLLFISLKCEALFGPPAGFKALHALRKPRSNRVIVHWQLNPNVFNPIWLWKAELGVAELGTLRVYDACDGELCFILEGFRAHRPHAEHLQNQADFVDSKFWLKWQTLSPPAGILGRTCGDAATRPAAVAEIIRRSLEAQPGRLIRYGEWVSDPSDFLAEDIARLLGHDADDLVLLECFVISNSAEVLAAIHSRHAASSRLALRFQLIEGGCCELSLLRPFMLDFLVLDRAPLLMLHELGHTLVPAGGALLKEPRGCLPFTVVKRESLTPIARPPPQTISHRGLPVELLIPDAAGLSLQLSTALQSRRGVGRILTSGDQDSEEWTEQQFDALLRSCGEELHTVCFGLAIDSQAHADYGAKAFAALMNLLRTLHRRLATSGSPKVVTVRVVTSRAAGPSPGHLHSGAIWGAVRSSAAEMEAPARLRLQLVDVDGTSDMGELASLLLDGCEEDELCLSAGSLYVQRWIRSRAARALMLPARDTSASFSLVPDISLRLGKVQFCSRSTTSAGPDDVVVEVKAVGLNFRDVMVALDRLPHASYASSYLGKQMGCEVVGRVVGVGSSVKSCRIGDEVSACVGGSIANRVVVKEVHTLPLTCSLPDALCSFSCGLAWHALKLIANLQRGQSILIHSALGGTGQAAMSVAKHLGLKVYATAGSEDKRERLRQKWGCEAVFDSRSTDWFAGLKDVTEESGVDCVLNSLSGEHVVLGMQSLRPCGIFLEIGKVDIYNETKLSLLLFRSNLRYAAIDMDLLLRDAPEYMRELRSTVLALMAEGALHPIETTLHPFFDAPRVLQNMAAGAHTGKLALVNEYYDGGHPPRHLHVMDQRNIFVSGTYLITGACSLEGFGMKLLLWAAWRGARWLLLVDRDPSLRRSADLLRCQSRISHFFPETQLRTVHGDVSKVDDVRRIWRAVSDLGMPPLEGVIHLAGVINDLPILDEGPSKKWQDEAAYQATALPKCAGALHLHEVSLEMDSKLTHFIVLGSTSSVIGNPGQANYSAANAFLEGLINMRRAMGLSGTVFHMHGLNNCGMLHENVRLLRSLRSRGIPAYGAAFALLGLEFQLRTGGAAMGLMPCRQVTVSGGEFNYMKWSSMLSDADARAFSSSSESEKRDFDVALREVSSIAEQILGFTPGSIDPRQSLASLGLSSLGSVEFSSSLQAKFGIKVSSIGLVTTASCHSLAEDMCRRESAVCTSAVALNDFRRHHELVVADDQLTFGRAAPPALPPAYVAPSFSEMPWVVESDIQELFAYVGGIKSRVTAGGLLEATPAAALQHVLVTGATGFIGAHVVAKLLQEPNITKVTCLIRQDPQENHAFPNDDSVNLTTARLRRTMVGLSLWKEDFESRISCVRGDISKDNIGLSASDLKCLSEEVDAVYHFAASISLTASYNEVRATNLLSLQGILNLCTLHKWKQLCVASTLFIFPEYAKGIAASKDSWIPEDGSLPDPCDVASTLHTNAHGYPYSKLGLERVCQRAVAELPDLPLCVMRLPLVGHNPITGATQENIASRSVTASLMTGAFCSRSFEMAPMSPVNRVVQDLVSVSLSANRVGHTFNLCSAQEDGHLNIEEAVNSFRHRGFNLRKVSYAEFKLRCKALGDADPLRLFWSSMAYMSDRADQDKSEGLLIRRENVTQSVMETPRDNVGGARLVPASFRRHVSYYASDDVCYWIHRSPKWLLRKVRPTMTYDDVVETAQSVLGWDPRQTMSDSEADDLKQWVALASASGKHNPDLNYMWSLGMRSQIQQSLLQRCRYWEYSTRLPESASAGGLVSLDKPVFIVGLNRSATTFLHRILALDRATFLTTLAYENSYEWTHRLFDAEALSGPHETDPRAHTYENSFLVRHLRDKMHPLGFTDHYGDAEDPEEDYFLTFMTFRSPYASLSLSPHMGKEYLVYLDDTRRKWKEAFAFEKNCILPVLEWQKRHRQPQGGRLWLLKNPNYLGCMEAIFDIYPNARVIHCYRDPVPQVESWLHITHGTVKALLFDEDAHGLEEVTEAQLKHSSTNANSFAQFRQDNRQLASRFIDVKFEDLISSPQQQVEKIFDHLGEGGAMCDPSFQAHLAAFLEADAARRDQRRTSRPAARLAAFGLSEKRVRQEFAQYTDFFA